MTGLTAAAAPDGSHVPADRPADHPAGAGRDAVAGRGAVAEPGGVKEWLGTCTIAVVAASSTCIVGRTHSLGGQRPQPGLPMASNAVSEAVGQRGESIVESRLLDMGAIGKPLFRPARLDGKWPTTDLYVELVDADATLSPFFFIQVKATDEGYSEDGTRLNVELRAEDARRLAMIPAPTYVVGVEIHADREAFILAVREGKGFSTMVARFDLSYPNLQKLYDEVLAFWKGSDRKPKA